jgi:hypothetical protein
MFSPAYNAPPLIGQRRPRRRRKRAVTLIVGLHRGDHLLVSADSGMYDDQEDAVIEAPKLEYGGPFAWGYSGYETLGLEFHAWMRAERGRLAGLGKESDLLKEVEAASNRINGKRWLELQASGVKRENLKYDHFAHVVVAGYTNGHGVILRLEYGCPSQILMTPGPLIVLGVDEMADKAYAAMLQDGTWTPDENGLQRLMDLAITFGADEWNLRQPVRMLRVTQTDSQDVSGERFRKRFRGSQLP